MAPMNGKVMGGVRVALAAALVAASVGCRKASARTMKGTDLRAAIGGASAVEVQCQDGATVTLAVGTDSVELVDSTYEGYSANPLSVEVRGKSVVVRQEAGGMFSDPRVAFTLRVPAGMDVRIHGVALELKGSLSAQKVEVDAKALRSDASIDAESISFKGSAVRLGAAKLKTGALDIEAEAFSDDGTLTVVGARKVSIRSRALAVDLAAPGSKSVEIQGGAVSGKVVASAASQLSVPSTVDVVRIP